MTSRAGRRASRSRRAAARCCGATCPRGFDRLDSLVGLFVDDLTRKILERIAANTARTNQRLAGLEAKVEGRLAGVENKRAVLPCGSRASTNPPRTPPSSTWP